MHEPAPEVEDIYLIWSNEHAGWWGPGGAGYTRKLSQAGRYSQTEALRIVVRAIPGTAHVHAMLPELPVRLADVQAAQGAHRALYPEGWAESWE